MLREDDYDGKTFFAEIYFGVSERIYIYLEERAQFVV
jgi:hypothetical protein